MFDSLVVTTFAFRSLIVLVLSPIASKRLSSLLVAVLLTSPALIADVVHLKSGIRLEGEVRFEKSAKVVQLRLNNGSIVRYSRDQVERIEYRPSPQKEFDERLKRLPPDDLPRLVELLVWAREKRLRDGVRGVAERLLRIDPHHPLAREALGYVVFKNRWILESELRQEPGLVRFDDEWMTKDERRRRQSAAAIREIEELVELVNSTNGVIRSYALEEIAARVKKSNFTIAEVFGRKLTDSSAAVRVVALISLGSMRVGGGGEAQRSRGGRVAMALHQLALRETNPSIRKQLRQTIARFYPRENFRLALSDAPNATAVEAERLAGILVATLRKSWVPELCGRVADNGGLLAVRIALRRLLGEDLGYDAAGWLKLWRRRQQDFQDVDV